jgi:hypothetical protein
MFNNKEMLNKKTEFLVAGAIGLYIVFFTRPAPQMVVQLLSSTVAQIAALAAVIYVGATQSLIVAVILALALVLSAPSREHLASGPADANLNPISAAKKEAESAIKKDGKEATMPTKPAPSAAPPKSKDATKDKKETFEADSLEKGMNMGSDDIAAAGQDIPAVKPESKGSESFSLMNAAPF